uniref:Uncharacterized protein n=1 Tax=Oryza sativa subsp. japonica TaxID=39947 RepID=Q75GA7_ORYSJ|nr:hypothetical protein [Oryza sativa Japonica Group]
MSLARGGSPRWTRSTDREGGGTPRGAHVVPTRHRRGSHAGDHAGDGTGGSDLPPDRTAEAARGRARAGTAQADPAAMAHSGTTVRRRRQTAATDGEWRRTASDDGATPSGKGRGRGEEIAGVSHRGFGRHGGATRTGRETTANNGRSPESPSEQEERGLEGERKLGEGEDAGRRRRPWRCSSASDEGGVPAADSDGGGVDEVARTTANATTSTARLGAAASGGRRAEKRRRWRAHGARAKEGTGAGDCKAKKREEGTGVLYIGLRGSIVAGMAAISPAEWGEVGRRERQDSQFESRPSRARARAGERGSGHGERGEGGDVGDVAREARERREWRLGRPASSSG